MEHPTERPLDNLPIGSYEDQYTSATADLSVGAVTDSLLAALGSEVGPGQGQALPENHSELEREPAAPTLQAGMPAYTAVRNGETVAGPWIAPPTGQPLFERSPSVSPLLAAAVSIASTVTVVAAAVFCWRRWEKRNRQGSRLMRSLSASRQRIRTRLPEA